VCPTHCLEIKSESEQTTVPFRHLYHWWLLEDNAYQRSATLTKLEENNPRNHCSLVSKFQTVNQNITTDQNSVYAAADNDDDKIKTG
jgi:hypothetical protein